MVSIKTWCCEEVIYTGPSIQLAVWNAVQIGVSLKYADLAGLDLNGIYISGADLSYADLTNTNFRNANLAEADLTGAIISDTNFNGAKLRNVNHSDCNLLGSARLQGTDLRGIYQRGSAASLPWPAVTPSNSPYDCVEDMWAETQMVTREADALAGCDREAQAEVDARQAAATEIISQFSYSQELQSSVYKLWFRGDLIYSGTDEAEFYQERTRVEQIQEQGDNG